MEFKDFKNRLQHHFNLMTKSVDKLFLTNVTGDELWNEYLMSIPEEVRQEYVCNSCRHFIKWYGNLVSIKDNRLVSIWDFDAKYPFEKTTTKMSQLVKSREISDIAVFKNNSFGTDYNTQVKLDPTTRRILDTIRWEHLFCIVPDRLRNRSYESEESIKGNFRDSKNVFKRSLEEITSYSIDVVLEIINQGSLYRGDQYKSQLELFNKCKKEYDKLPEVEKDIYCWDKSSSIGPNISRIRSTSIGTLLVDISNGIDLDTAVTSYERKVAPENYKRPKSLVTKSMIDSAQKKVEELGLSNSLSRRHCTIDDITVNNVLFVNRNLKGGIKGSSVFDQLKESMPENVKKFSRAAEISIEDFCSKVIPTASSIELLFENKNFGNLMTLTAPVDGNAPSLFKWNNGFSWTYNGDAADSFIKQKVKAAGGNVSGELRCSLHWFNYDDLDIHVFEPNGNEIFFGKKSSPTSGTLDIDMNAGTGTSRDAVENIIWTNKDKMLEGKYKLVVNNYCFRETSDPGFETEIECNGVIHKFDYKNAVRNKQDIVVAEFKYTKENGVEILSSISGTSKVSSEDVWGIGTNKFHQVSLMMLSPNFWDGNQCGNKHYFFILEGCKNPNSVRGFYNEFLKDELNTHRKVFEVLGSKMKIDYSDTQLSGLGFSSTMRNSIICRVKGATERILKINF